MCILCANSARWSFKERSATYPFWLSGDHRSGAGVLHRDVIELKAEVAGYRFHHVRYCLEIHRIPAIARQYGSSNRRVSSMDLKGVSEAEAKI